MIDIKSLTRAELEAPGSPFETTTIEVRGVPVRVFKSAPPNMRVLWEATAAHGDKEYVVYEDEHYSYAQIHEQVRKLAAAFVAQGVQPGDRIALAMRNYPEWITGYWAGIAVGAAVVGQLHERVYALPEAPDVTALVDFFFASELAAPALDTLLGKPYRGRPEVAVAALHAAAEALGGIEAWAPDAIEAALRAAAETTGEKPGDLFMLCRVAVTGKPVTPPLFETMAIVGEELTLARLRAAARVAASE